MHAYPALSVAINSLAGISICISISISSWSNFFCVYVYVILCISDYVCIKPTRDAARGMVPVEGSTYLSNQNYSENTKSFENTSTPPRHGESNSTSPDISIGKYIRYNKHAYIHPSRGPKFSFYLHTYKTSAVKIHMFVISTLTGMRISRVYHLVLLRVHFLYLLSIREHVRYTNISQFLGSSIMITYVVA